MELSVNTYFERVTACFNPGIIEFASRHHQMPVINEFGKAGMKAVL